MLAPLNSLHWLRCLPCSHFLAEGRPPSCPAHAPPSAQTAIALVAQGLDSTQRAPSPSAVSRERSSPDSAAPSPWSPVRCVHPVRCGRRRACARPDSLRLFRLGYALDALDSVYFEYTEQALLVATLGDPVHDEPELQCPEVDQSAEVDQSCHMSGTVSVTCQGRDIGPFPAVVMYT
eukprot:5778789-Prymnesium_polylepis.1